MEFVTFLSDMRSVMTVACLIVFLGIVYWSYNGKQQHAFDEAANLPFADESTDRTVTSNVTPHTNVTTAAEPHHG